MNRDILLCGLYEVLENRYFASHYNFYFVSRAAIVDGKENTETNDC